MGVKVHKLHGFLEFLSNLQRTEWWMSDWYASPERIPFRPVNYWLNEFTVNLKRNFQRSIANAVVCISLCWYFAERPVKLSSAAWNYIEYNYAAVHDCTPGCSNEAVLQGGGGMDTMTFLWPEDFGLQFGKSRHETDCRMKKIIVLSSVKRFTSGWKAL